MKRLPFSIPKIAYGWSLPSEGILASCSLWVPKPKFPQANEDNLTHYLMGSWKKNRWHISFQHSVRAGIGQCIDVLKGSERGRECQRHQASSRSGDDFQAREQRGDAVSANLRTTVACFRLRWRLAECSDAFAELTRQYESCLRKYEVNSLSRQYETIQYDTLPQVTISTLDDMFKLSIFEVSPSLPYDQVGPSKSRMWSAVLLFLLGPGTILEYHDRILPDCYYAKSLDHLGRYRTCQGATTSSLLPLTAPSNALSSFAETGCRVPNTICQSLLTPRCSHKCASLGLQKRMLASSRSNEVVLNAESSQLLN